MRLLVVSKMVPLPLDSGGRVRLWNLLSRIACRAEVLLLAFGDEARSAEIAEAGLECRIVPAPPRPSGLGALAHRARHSVSRIPAEVAHWRSREMSAQVASAVRTFRPDIVQAEFYQMLPYLEEDVRGALRCVTAHDLGWVPVERGAALSSGLQRAYRARQASSTRRFEAHAYSGCDGVWVMSETDQELLRALGVSSRCEVVPNGVDTTGIPFEPARPEAERVLFVGSAAHQPNVDALRHYMERIHPLVLREHPSYRLDVVGMTADDVQAPDADAVDWHGRVPDVLPFYRRARAALAPIRIGGGTRIKILEAMAAGVPVVTTSIGVEGITAIQGTHCLTADEPSEFAKGVGMALTQPLDSLVRQARCLVEDRYSWDAVAEQQLTIYEEMLLGGRRHVA